MTDRRSPTRVARDIARAWVGAVVGVVMCLAVLAPGAVRTVSRVRPPDARQSPTEAAHFSLRGQAIGMFFPGVTRQINLTITNPFDYAIAVGAVSVTVDRVTTVRGAPAPGCDGTSNLVVLHDLAVSGTEVVVEPKSSRSLAELGIPRIQWPEIQMPDLATDQNACQGAEFTLTYTGDASAVTRTHLEVS